MDVVIIGSADDVKALLAEQEKRELEALRARVRLAAMRDSEQRFQMVEAECEHSLQLLEEAYVTLADDDMDDFETALQKARKLEKIEREHDRAISLWERQRARVAWERSQARQPGMSE